PRSKINNRMSKLLVSRPRNRWFVWFAPVTVPAYLLYLAAMSAIAGSYYLTIEQTIAPIALWIKRSRRSNLADSDASRELDQSRPPRWVAWLAIAMLAVGVALAIGTSAAATVILLPWIRHGAGQIGTIAAPLIFLICLLATFTALAAAAHVAIWAV